MHLAVDALGVKHSGGAVVLVELLRAAVATGAFRRVTVFSTPRALRDFDLPAGAALHERPMPRAEAPFARRVAWYERGLGSAAAEVGADLVFCMSGMGTGRSVRHVTFIQQSLPFSPEALARMAWRDQVRFRAIRALMARSASRSVRVMTQTPTMADWVGRAFHLAPERLCWFMPAPRPLVVPTGGAAGPMAATPRGARLLYVGNEAGYKNVSVAIEGMELLRRTFPDAALFLTWPADHPAGRQPGVHPLGYLDPSALAEAYAEADLLVQPSLVETVGLSMNEAMSLGTPVVCADRPYAHDLCADAALYFDPRSPADFARQAERALRDAEGTRRRVVRGLELLEVRRAGAPYERMVEALHAEAMRATPAAHPRRPDAEERP